GGGRARRVPSGPRRCPDDLRRHRPPLRAGRPARDDRPARRAALAPVGAREPLVHRAPEARRRLHELPRHADRPLRAARVVLARAPRRPAPPPARLADLERAQHRPVLGLAGPVPPPLRAAAARVLPGDQEGRPRRPRRAHRLRELLVARARPGLSRRHQGLLRPRRGAPVLRPPQERARDRAPEPRGHGALRRCAQGHRDLRADLALGQGQDGQPRHLGDDRGRPGRAPARRVRRAAAGARALAHRAHDLVDVADARRQLAELVRLVGPAQARSRGPVRRADRQARAGGLPRDRAAHGGPRPRMIVAVDARALAGAPRGVARYTRELVGALAAAFPDDEYRLVVPGRRAVDALAAANVATVRPRSPGRVVHGVAAVARRPRLARLAGRDAWVAWLPAPAPVAVGDIPYVVTVHDLSWEERPADFTAYERAWHALARPRALARGAAAVVADAEPTRAALLERWRLDPARVRVVSPGVPAPAAPRGANRFGRYVLYVGALEPRKAPELLLGAFARARARGLDADLVVAGT